MQPNDVLPCSETASTEPAAPSAARPASFTERELRTALGQFATGVTVVTTRDRDGHPVGLTVSSFNSVSLHPPLVLWSLGMRSGTLEAFQACEHYAIHVLGADQLHLAETFSRRGIDRFAGLNMTEGLHGLPLLANTVAVFECRNHRQYPEGDHVIFVGEVQRVSCLPGAPALVYHHGQLLQANPTTTA